MANKELVLLVKTDKKTNQTSTTVFTSLYPAIRVMNQAAKELLKKTTCKFGKNCFSTDDVKYQVIELGDISWDRDWDKMSFEQEITENKIPVTYNAVVQISKYSELNWSYLSADDDLWNTGCESPADYYIKFCEDYPDFTYKDYRWENIQDDGKQFELYHKDELLLTIYFVGGGSYSPANVGHSIYDGVPHQESFEKFIEKFTGKAKTKLVDDVNKESRWFIKRFEGKECKQSFGFPSFKDAKIALRDLKKLYREKVGKGVMLEDNAVYAPNDVMFVIWPNDSYKPKQEDNEKFVVNNVGKAESQAVNYKN